MDRRTFLRGAGLALGASLVGTGPWRHIAALAQPARRGSGPYGPLSATPDANGVRLPSGFTSRVVARSGQPVVADGYVWHGRPDGAACFAADDGGWILVSNAELSEPEGGVSALRFSASGEVIDGRRILDETGRNCAGGPTPWGTWLSCEEVERGYVYECDPTGAAEPVRADGLGRFVHEAAGVDAEGKAVYLTEDQSDGRLYRALPEAWPARGRPDLSKCQLQAAVADVEAAERGPTPVTWVDVAATGPYRGDETAAFNRGEGLWVHAGVVYFTTSADDRVWALDTAASTIEVLYAGNADLRGPDNITVSPHGEMFVAEDGDDMQLVVLAATADGRTEVAPFLQIVGHRDSEVTGPCFSPDGRRLYVSSQRGTDGDGVVFEISGPFGAAAGAAAPRTTAVARRPPAERGDGDAEDEGLDAATLALGAAGAIAAAAGGKVLLDRRRGAGRSDASGTAEAPSDSGGAPPA